jgi:hypothetical protein
MRILFASILAVAAVACSSSQKNDEAVQPVKEAAAKPEPTEPVEVAAGPDLSTPYKAIYHALLAAQVENEDEAFQAYLAVVHPDEMGDDQSVETLRSEQWARFRKQANWYVRAESRADYIMTKMVPAQLSDDVVEVRIFVRDLVHNDNVPAEVLLRRHGDEWRIVSNSM